MILPFAVLSSEPVIALDGRVILPSTCWSRLIGK